MLFPGKKEFYSNLSMEDITDADYKHTKKKSGKIVEYKI